MAPSGTRSEKVELEGRSGCHRLVVSLLDAPRALSTDEAAMMVDLVMRGARVEHEKHTVRVMAALTEIRPFHEQP